MLLLYPKNSSAVCVVRGEYNILTTPISQRQNAWTKQAYKKKNTKLTPERKADQVPRKGEHAVHAKPIIDSSG